MSGNSLKSCGHGVKLGTEPRVKQSSNLDPLDFFRLSTRCYGVEVQIPTPLGDRDGKGFLYTRPASSSMSCGDIQ